MDHNCKTLGQQAKETIDRGALLSFRLGELERSGLSCPAGKVLPSVESQWIKILFSVLVSS